METQPNAGGSFEKETDSNELFVTVNTIDQTVFVERLPNPIAISRGSGDFIRYGSDNLYPNKIKSMAERSQSTMSAIAKLSEFTAGQGFEEINGQDINTLEVNEEGQTLFDILDHSADEKSEFRGLAIHFNYNIFGEISEIQEIPFETLRYNKDLTKLVFCPDWSRSGRFGNNKKIEFDLYDPEKAKEQIEEAGGLDEYKGQVLYWIKKRKQIYTLCRFDAALDDTQFEHESGVYKLRNIQNDYSSGHIMFYPAALKSVLEKEGLIKDIKNSRGAKNAGKTKAVPLNSSFMDALGSRKMIEEIPRTGVDKLFLKQNEETKFNIYSIFNQPPILSGISKDGMFNAESFVDAFDYYNSVTEKDRQEVERIFNKFMPFTIWGLDNLKIKPLEFMRERDGEAQPKEKKDGEENNT